MTADLSFWAGLAVGILSTMAGSAGVVVWLIRKAPHKPDGYGRAVIHVGDDDPPDPLPLQVPCGPSYEAFDRPVVPRHRWFTRPAEPVDERIRAIVEGYFVDEVTPPLTEDQWDQLATRGPTTDYVPGVVHHDLVATEWPDGTVTYNAPASHVYDRATGQHLCCADDPPDSADEGIR